MNRSEEDTGTQREHDDVLVWLSQLFASPEYRHFVYINLVTFTISLFGVAFNIVNMVVFFRMGFKENINISLFSLGAVDMISLLILMWCCACVNPWHMMVELPFWPLDFWNTGAWLSGGVGSHACWMTSFIAIERCLCVTMPLKVKVIVTPTITTVVILVSFVLNLASVLPALVKMNLEWKVDPVSNKEVLGISYGDSDLKFIAYVIIDVLRLSSYPCLLVATLALIVSLKRKSEWRTKMSVTSSSNLKSLSSRDTKVVQMVLVLSCIVLLTNTSVVVMAILTTLGFPSSIRLLGWYFSQFLFSCNSSINIFFYYKMSASYRKEFETLIVLRPKAI